MSKNKADFGGQTRPYRASIVLEDLDLESTQNVDLLLPKNFKYKIESVELFTKTAPSAVTTKAKVGLFDYDGSTATEIRGDVDVQSSSTAVSDVLFKERGGDSGYVYYQNIAAATTTGLCTQNTALNVAGALAGEASPDVPRKLVITTVDNAGDDLAGTVTLTGLDVDGEQITEVVTIAAGTDSHTTENVFATFTAGTFDFGETAEATNDTLDIGQATAVGLPSKNAVPIKIVSGGSEEAASSIDPDQGALVFTTAPNGTNDYEVWYRTAGQPAVIQGGNQLRVAVTAATVTGSHVADVLIHLTKF